MWNAILGVQWKRSRIAALLAALLAFSIPFLSIQLLRVGPEGGRAAFMVAAMQSMGVAYALVAAGTGLAYGMLAWSADRRTRHVYALSLPVTRTRYAGMRFGAGALFLLIPALALLVSCAIAIAIIQMPAGLHAYPFSLTLRFLLASAVAYAVFFAAASITPRTAGIILGILAALVVVSFALSALSIRANPLVAVLDVLFGPAGPLSVFTGRWMLIDA